jgi:alpha-L-fucosidase
MTPHRVQPVKSYVRQISLSESMSPTRSSTLFASACLALALIAPLTVASAAEMDAAEIARIRTESGKQFGMGPQLTPEIVAGANSALKQEIPKGPFEPTWPSIAKNYKVPQWFTEGKFGVFLHWGLYAVPAYHNEWYQKHMYATYADWHAQNFGPQLKFGYKDFIPLFTCEKYDANQWAELFKKAGARYVIPTAQHHDNFALWDSALTDIDAKDMGPKRDLIGELAVASRKHGLKFGVSNHGIENFTFIRPKQGLAEELKAAKADLFDPRWNDIYHVADRSPAECEKFLVDWVARNFELIDKYQVDMLWFDNGANSPLLDPLKLKIAAYYYNRAAEWGKEVSISTKKLAYEAGSILDFEKVGRAPKEILPGAWQVDEPIGSTWGYTKGMRVRSGASVIDALVDTVSKGGNLLLNLSPMADGSIPEEQQKTLLEVGKWLEVNGDAIYGTHPWTTFRDGPDRTAAHFTAKGDAVYALLAARSGEEVTLAALGSGKPGVEPISSVSLVGDSAKLQFTQSPTGLKVTLPAGAGGKFRPVLKITGPKINPPGPQVPAPFYPPAGQSLY